MNLHYERIKRITLLGIPMLGSVRSFRFMYVLVRDV
jgi:hypothetical protein